jgi:hypothetical protein
MPERAKKKVALAATRASLADERSEAGRKEVIFKRDGCSGDSTDPGDAKGIPEA